MIYSTKFMYNHILITHKMMEMYDKRFWMNKTIDLLENNIDKVDWKRLAFNRNAIYLLEKEVKENPNSEKMDCLLILFPTNKSHSH